MVWSKIVEEKKKPMEMRDERCETFSLIVFVITK